MSVILKPILTEKIAILQERQNKYAFYVNKNNNKVDVKKAVEKKPRQVKKLVS